MSLERVAAAVEGQRRRRGGVAGHLGRLADAGADADAADVAYLRPVACVRSERRRLLLLLLRLRWRERIQSHQSAKLIQFKSIQLISVSI